MSDINKPFKVRIIGTGALLSEHTTPAHADAAAREANAKAGALGIASRYEVTGA